MVTKEYAMAAVETLEILKTLEKEEYKKIPNEVIGFLEKNKDAEYQPDIDFGDEDIKDKIMKKTKEILSGIYLEYLCLPEDKSEYLKKVRKKEAEYQEKLKEKYNVEDLFKKRKN